MNGKRSGIGFRAVLLIMAVAMVLIGYRVLRRAMNPPFLLRGAELVAFTELEPIDAHTHVFHSGPAFIAMLGRLHMHVLDILYVDDTNPYRAPTGPERQDGLDFVAANPEHARLCTTFDPFQFNAPGFPEQAIVALDQDYARGAVATKIWKNLGMEVKNASGQYVLPDDPRLEPIYRDVAAHNKTLVAHLGDPDFAWDPTIPYAYANYYKSHPEWDLSRKPDAPRKEAILQSADRLLAGNPRLRVVAAHFGSMEDHLDDLAIRLEHHPNLAVDTAARLANLTLQPRDRVRAFFLKYQDRILYGTDLNFYPWALEPLVAQGWEKQYALDWRYFSTDDRFDFEGHRVQGLKLPRAVLRKLYHDNAVHWFPGMDAGWRPAKTG